MAEVISPYAFPGIRKEAVKQLGPVETGLYAVPVLLETLDIEEQRLFSGSRKTEHVVGRQLLQFLLSVVWKLGPSETARSFWRLSIYAKRWATLDHTTVLNAVGNIYNAIDSAPDSSPHSHVVHTAYEAIKNHFALRGMGLPDVQQLRIQRNERIRTKKLRKHLKTRTNTSYEDKPSVPGMWQHNDGQQDVRTLPEDTSKGQSDPAGGAE